MARDRETEDALRGALTAALPRGTHLAERPMFGALCFMLHGNMLAGASADGILIRTGKDRMAEALALPGTGPMEMSGRTMGGFVRADETALTDDETLARLISIAVEVTQALPAK